MEKYKFYVVDDNEAVCQIIANIIEEDNLGKVIGASTNGKNAIDDILTYNPEIIIIDVLMPELDGFETIKQLQEEGYMGKYIFLSQVQDKSFIKQGYNLGAEFYITKPINRIEIVSIIEKVIKILELERTFHILKENINTMQTTIQDPKENSINRNVETYIKSDYKVNSTSLRDEVISILADLGVLNQAGSRDILEIAEYFSKLNKEDIIIRMQNLNLLYKELSQIYLEKGIENLEINENAISRRISRLIAYSMENLATLGVEDYHHPKFEKFAYKFFDFTELRKKMLYLKGHNGEKSKINVKKFLEGLLIEVGFFE